jgi:hypothetical protein
MSGYVLIDELHLSVYVPPRLSNSEQRDSANAARTGISFSPVPGRSIGGPWIPVFEAVSSNAFALTNPNCSQPPSLREP